MIIEFNTPFHKKIAITQDQHIWVQPRAVKFYKDDQDSFRFSKKSSFFYEDSESNMSIFSKRSLDTDTIFKVRLTKKLYDERL
jgi:hypothetical protein